MRAFIAFDFNSKIKEKIGKIQSDFMNTAQNSKIKYVDYSQFHQTVFFLDEISEQKTGKIISELENLQIENIPALSFEEIEYFPSSKNPKVIVLKSSTNNVLEKLVSDIDKSLNKLGFRRDKKFKPHITIGRVRDNFEYQDFKFTAFKANPESLVLYKSTLTKVGPIYESICKINLS